MFCVSGDKPIPTYFPHTTILTSYFDSQIDEALIRTFTCV